MSYNLWEVLHLSLMQLVDRGRVNVKDVASDIGVAPDSLSASLAVMPNIMKIFYTCTFLNKVFEYSSCYYSNYCFDSFN